jgi:hypothetical protein
MVGTGGPDGGVSARAVIVLGWLQLADAAEQRRSAADAALSGAKIDRRIAFIERRLDACKRHAQIWYWSRMTSTSARRPASRSARR